MDLVVQGFSIKLALRYKDWLLRISEERPSQLMEARRGWFVLEAEPY